MPYVTKKRYTVHDFDVGDLAFSAPEPAMKGNGKVVRVVSAQGNQPLEVYLQTPALVTTFGADKYDPNRKKAGEDDPAAPDVAADDREPERWSLDVSFAGFETDPDVAKFKDDMHAIDAKVLASATAADWNGVAAKSKKRAVGPQDLEFAYQMAYDRPLVREAPSDGRYADRAPSMKIKIPFRDGKVTADFFDEDRQPVDMTYVTPGCTVRAIIKLSIMWLIQDKIHLKWQVHQVQVLSRASEGPAAGVFDFDDGPGVSAKRKRDDFPPAAPAAPAAPLGGLDG